MKRSILLLFIVTGITVLSTAQTPGPAFRQEGIASWYGTEFDGKPTASGEVFNSASYTAAHPSLPFGSILTVTNLQNNRRVTVKVNDRGPFVSERIIDLSLAAAEVLQMVETGTARVTIEHAASSMLGPVGNPALPITPALSTTPQSTAVTPVAALPPPQQVPAAPINAAPQYTPPPVQPSAAPAPQYTPPPAQPSATPAAPLYMPPPVQPVAAPVVPQYMPPPAQPAPVPEAVYTPPAPIAAVPQQMPLPSATPAAPEYVPPPAPTAPPVFSVPPASIVGNVPAPGSSGSFRLQVASFRVPRNALNTFDKLKAAGLNPRYEQHGDLYRVVLPGLNADEIRPIAQVLGNNGFREVLIHREAN